MPLQRGSITCAGRGWQFVGSSWGRFVDSMSAKSVRILPINWLVDQMAVATAVLQLVKLLFLGAYIEEITLLN